MTEATDPLFLLMDSLELDVDGLECFELLCHVSSELPDASASSLVLESEFEWSPPSAVSLLSDKDLPSTIVLIECSPSPSPSPLPTIAPSPPTTLLLRVAAKRVSPYK